MAINRQKISQMTPKGSDLDPTDLMEVSVQTGSGYETRSITGQEIINAASGGALDLQAVTDNGNTTTNALNTVDGIGNYGITAPNNLTTGNYTSNTIAYLNNDGTLGLGNGSVESKLKNTNATNTDVILEFPDKPTGSYTIATTSDIPSLTGYVPYTGATQDVDLGTNKISTKSLYVTGTAGNGHIHMKHQSADATATGQSTAVWADTNGDIKWKNDGNYKTTLKTSTNTADRTYIFPNSDCTLTPDSRTISINGTSQDLSVDRTYTITDANLSMSDITTNNVSITQHGFAPKAPNDITKFLRGDGTWATAGGGLTVGTTAITSGTVGRILFEGTGNVLQEDSALFWDNTNKRLGVGTSTPLSPLELYGSSAGVTTPLQIRNTLGGGNAIAAIKFTNTSSTAFNAQNWAWIGSKRDATLAKGRLVFAASDNIANDPSTTDIGMVLGFDKSLLIGIDGIAGARLDVRAQGALSTDIAFRVRNSADSVTLTEIQGTGNLITRHNSSGSSLGLFHRTDTTGFSLTTGTSGYGTGNGIEIVTHTWILSSGARQFAFTTNGGTDGDLWTFQNNGSGAGKRMSLSKSGNETFCWSGENFSIGGNIWGNPPTETNSFGIKNGTAPSTNATDAFKLYSADITAGNAAPHFRTENGNIIKLYRETTAVAAATFVANTSLIANDTATFDGYTIGQVVKALRNLGILA